MLYFVFGYFEMVQLNLKAQEPLKTNRAIAIHLS